MEDFDYSSHIAPLKRNYFSGRSNYSSGLSQDAIGRLQEQQIFNLEQRNIQNLKLRQVSNSLRESELRFEQQRLEIEKTKNDARIERESLITIPEATKHLDGILNDPNISDSEKAGRVADYKFQNAPLIGASKSFNTLLTAAEGKLESRRQELERVNPLINSLVQTGNPETLKRVLKDKNLPMAEDYITTAEAVAASKKAEATSELALKEQEFARGLKKDERAAQTAMVTNYLNTLEKIKPPRDDDPTEFGSLRGGEKTPTIPQVKQFKFAKEDRLQLEDMVRTLNENVDEGRLSSASDEEVYSAALESTTGTLKRLSGFGSQFQRDKLDKFRTTPPTQ
jgi:hypothetical protein